MDEESVIEKIIGRRQRKTKEGVFTEYLVRWEGYTEEDDSWVTKEECLDLDVTLSDFKEALAAFEKESKEKAKMKTPAAKKPQQKEGLEKWQEAQERQKQAVKAHTAVVRTQQQIQKEVEAERRRLELEEERKHQEQRENRRAIQDAHRDKLWDEIYAGVDQTKEEEDEQEFVPPARKAPEGRVKSLWNMTIAFVSENLDLYEGFENVPVPWKARMYGYLSQRNKLDAEKFSQLLDPEQRLLDLTICRDSVSDAFFRALKVAPMLQKFILHDCETMTPMCFLDLVIKCPNLNYLDFTGCGNLYRLDRAQTLPNLETLILDHCAGFELHAENSDYVALPALKVLSLNNIRQRALHQDTLAYVLATSKKLKELRVRNSRTVIPSADEVVTLARQFKPNCPDLEVLDFAGTDASHLFKWWLEKIGNQKKFTGSLRRVIFPVDYAIQPEALTLFPNLTEFNIYSSWKPEFYEEASKIWNKHITYLDTHNGNWAIIQNRALELSEIKTLKIRGLQTVMSFVRVLKNFPSLETLELSSCQHTMYHDEEYMRLDDSILPPERIDWQRISLPKRKNLTRLTLKNIQWMTPEIFKAIFTRKNFPNLEYLDARGIGQREPQLLRHIVHEFRKLSVLLIDVLDKLEVAFGEDPIVDGDSLEVLSITINRDGIFHDEPYRWDNFLSNFPNLRALFVSGIYRSHHHATRGLVDALIPLHKIKYLGLLNTVSTKELGPLLAARRFKEFILSSHNRVENITKFIPYLARDPQLVPSECGKFADIWNFADYVQKKY
eukprot:TRINITY_DN549_c3_g1_i1.p1 TRINITY_DN549_c3_g1~~TRINITY_DN549_c3_g1_i1.p1  ORF type:complete len:780 (-),score=135.87 TRINITY_DN549_c3_g1_i1:23-2362(-)